jgi:hypothetical protein
VDEVTAALEAYSRPRMISQSDAEKIMRVVNGQ